MHSNMRPLRVFNMWTSQTTRARGKQLFVVDTPYTN